MGAIQPDQDVYMKRDTIADPTGRTHAERALIALRQRILSGQLSGGTRLFEVALADALEISRTPVRAALSRLAEEGLLERAAGGGFVVRSFALPDVVDTIELRGILEGTAARLAAERGADPTRLAAAQRLVEQLDRLFENGPQNIDIAKYSELNSTFHTLLAEMCKSAVILREIERVTALPFASPSAFLADHTHADAFRNTLLSAQEQHRALIEAIAGREGARAEAIAREHARTARRNVDFVFAANPDLKLALPSLALVTG